MEINFTQLYFNSSIRHVKALLIRLPVPLFRGGCIKQSAGNYSVCTAIHLMAFCFQFLTLQRFYKDMEENPNIVQFLSSITEQLTPLSQVGIKQCKLSSVTIRRREEEREKAVKGNGRCQAGQ